MAYKISEYFPVGARVAAAREQYQYLSLPPCSGEGCCPIAVMFNAIGATDGVHEFMAPGPSLTANTLAPLLGMKRRPVYDAARKFIADWDKGKITDLYSALGVEEYRA